MQEVKVETITHTFTSDGQATTRTSLLLYRATGSQAESTLVAPSRPTFETPSVLPAVALSSRWGQDPSQSGAQIGRGTSGTSGLPLAEASRDVNTYKNYLPRKFYR